MGNIWKRKSTNKTMIYAGQSVKKIEMNKNEYEVELTNGLDLTFNKHFLLIDID